MDTNLQEVLHKLKLEQVKRELEFKAGYQRQRAAQDLINTGINVYSNMMKLNTMLLLRGIK